MRLRFMAAVLTAIMAVGLAAPQSAHAFVGWYDHDSRRLRLGPSRAVRSWRYSPRYRYRLHSPHHPYAYRYERRGYYPYYGAGYWRPAHISRGRYNFTVRAPRYYRGWGYGPRPCYDRRGHKVRCYRHHRSHHRDARHRHGHRW